MKKRVAEPEVLQREQPAIDMSAAKPVAKVSPHAVAEHTGGNNTLLDAIARAASNPAIDMDKVERLYKMHTDLMNRQAETEFNGAMARAQNKILPVVKNAYNDQTRSQYAKLDAINDAVMPIITAEGLSISFNSGEGAPNGMLRTVAIVAHSAGFKRVYTYDLPLDNVGIRGSENKTTLHAIGSTSSYARRYLVCLIFNVATEDDTDGNVKKESKSQPILSDADKAIKEKLEACGSIDGLKKIWGGLDEPTRKRLNDVFGECRKRITEADKKAAAK